MISVENLTPKNPQGIILYRGPSLIDGKPIVVIATGFSRKSKNPKTGNVIQTWILPATISPLVAWQKGMDGRICGDCKHSSPKNGGWNTCYVNVYQAPNNIWRAWKRGNYEKPNTQNINLFRGRFLRIGAYGDPAAVSTKVWDILCGLVSDWTGYTHQWHSSKTDKKLKKYCMASVDSPEEASKAHRKGWRTFRCRSEDESILKNEFVCPASEQGGRKIKCIKCGNCKGGRYSLSRKDPVIVVHGRGWRCKRFVEIMRLRRNKKRYRHLIGGF